VEHTPSVTGVVVGVDGSRSALAAVKWAAAEAARRGAELDLVQVLPSADRSGVDAGLPHGRARALLYRAAGAALAVAPATRVSMATVYGRVGPALVSYAADGGLLVVGTNGPGGPIPLSVGRVLAEVTAHADCPVIIVPRTRADPSTPSSRPVFLAATDTTADERALDFAAETAHRWAVPLVALSRRTGRAHGGHSNTQGLTTGDAARYRERYPGLTIESRVAAGRTDVPVWFAQQGAQLIVVSSLLRGSAEGALSGWTRHFLPIFSPCPVAVVRPTSRSAAARSATPSTDSASG
jgi:nucleotide-binding universal stress UspA family protein